MYPEGERERTQRDRFAKRVKALTDEEDDDDDSVQEEEAGV